MESTGWQSVVVAICIIGFVLTITVVAIKRYNTADDALKIIGAFSGILGIMSGAFVTYFFTRDSINEAKERANEYKIQFTEAKTEKDALESLWKKIAAKPDNTSLATIKLDPDISLFMNDLEESSKKRVHSHSVNQPSSIR